MDKQGFTLIELSIVLVIIGLIVGGVLVGRDLIRSAELQSVISDVNKYKTAVYTFMDKYNALPGDMTNATTIWGANPGCAGDATSRGTGTQTCNGNGDAQVNPMNDGSQGLEADTFWQHLGNAGLIQGSYSGVDPNDSEPGINVAASRIPNAGFNIAYSVMSGDGSMYDGFYGNSLFFGANTHSWNLTAPIVSVKEAFSIDRKFDDGLPPTGMVRAWKSSQNPGCTTADNATAVYAANTSNARLCGLIFMTGF